MFSYGSIETLICNILICVCWGNSPVAVFQKCPGKCLHYGVGKTPWQKVPVANLYFPDANVFLSNTQDFTVATERLGTKVFFTNILVNLFST